MLNNILSICVLIVTGVSINAQTQHEAQSLFDRYEYARAAVAYEQYAATKPLANDDLKRWVYSYHATGNYKKSLPLLDTIIAQKDAEPAFYYWKAEALKNEGRHEDAIVAYENYQKMDGEFDVTVQIASCKVINSWKAMEYTSLSSIAINTSKASTYGELNRLGQMMFIEAGMDSIGTKQGQELADDSELMLSRPYADKNGVLKRIEFDASFDYTSITGFTLHPTTSMVLFSGNQPLSQDQMINVSHIYEGVFDPNTFQVSNTKLWLHSGMNDTTATAHPSFHPNGEWMVYSKIGPKTNNNSDIYESKLTNNSWTNPTKMMYVNTSFNELYPKFDGDSILYFATDGMAGFGGLDIYRTTIIDDAITNNLSHLPSPINTEKDDFGFGRFTPDSVFFNSNRFGGKGDDDIWVMGTTKPPYVIPFDLAEYIKSWIPPKVYFNYDKHTPLTDFSFMPKLMEMMEKHPTLRVDIEGHTDIRGNEFYNLELSKLRAKSIGAELVKEGLLQDRIDITPYGINKPELPSTPESPEDIHALNRVVIITIKVQ